jgi:hypothetical protein
VANPPDNLPAAEEEAPPISASSTSAKAKEFYLDFLGFSLVRLAEHLLGRPHDLPSQCVAGSLCASTLGADNEHNAR